jgi:hypothetical protein
MNATEPERHIIQQFILSKIARPNLVPLVDSYCLNSVVTMWLKETFAEAKQSTCYDEESAS